MANDNMDDNIAKVFVAFLKASVKLAHEFKWPLSIAIIGVVFSLGWLDVPMFKAIVDGFVALVQAAIPQVGS